MSDSDGFVWERLAAELDRIGAEGPESDVRRVLAILVRPILDLPPRDEIITAPDPATCPNCATPASSARSPYCGDACREESAFVRQIRRAAHSETIFDAERQAGLGQVFWRLLGAGYPARIAMIRPKIRSMVILRDGGQCRKCGRPATTVDHVTTACNRPINLQAVCEDCTVAKPFGDSHVVDASRPKIDELARRIRAGRPLRPSDDDETWDWRRYLKARESVLTSGTRTAGR